MKNGKASCGAFLICICSLGFFATVSHAGDAEASQPDAISLKSKQVDARWRLSYDRLPVTSSETMGLLGAHYDVFPLGKKFPLYVGFGGYGALTGDRGGFFTGGLTAGYLAVFKGRHGLDVGVHAGGGGGANAFPGDGTLVRAHIAYDHLQKPLGWRMGIAHTRFLGTTNPHDSDTHFFVGWQIKQDWMWLSEVPPVMNHGQFPTSRMYLAPTWVSYLATDNVGRGGAALSERQGLLGIQFGQPLADAWDWRLTALGAGVGGIDGYATVMFGVVRRGLTRLDRLTWELGFDIGMAGGGDVDTGGGLMITPSMGLNYVVSEPLIATATLGWLTAPSGNFDTPTLGVSLIWNQSFQKPRGGAVFAMDEKSVTTWEFGALHKTYRLDPDVVTKAGVAQTEDVHSLAFELSRKVYPHIALFGQAVGAWRGNVGAYAEGWFGGRLQLRDCRQCLDVYIDGQLGVAGGGGMDVGSGVLWQVDAGLNYQLGPIVMRGSLGRTESRSGSFAADTVNIHLSIQDFSVLSR